MQMASLAIVGAGQFGTRYIQSLKEIAGVEIRWVCDHKVALAREVADGINDVRVTDDLSDVCADSKVDAVVVVTPENAHRVVAEQALQAGKHVIVEKPLATKEEDALALVDAAKEAGKLLMTAFLLRFDYRYARLQQALGEIGAVRNIYAYRNFDKSLFRLYSRTHSFIENAIHDIDLILWYVQSRVRSGHGYCRNTMGLENPDINWGVLEFENDAIAVVQTTWLYPPQKHENLQWNSGIQVMGDRGVLEVRFDSDGFRSNTEIDGQLVRDQTGWATIHNEPRGAFGAMLRHYVKCICNEATYSGATPEEAVESMRAAVMLAENSQSSAPTNK